MRRKRWLDKALYNLFRFLDISYNINSGGCCYTTYLVAKELEHLGIKYKLVLYDDKYTNSHTKKIPIKKGIKSRNSNMFPSGDFTCAHYTLYISGIGIVNNEDYEEWRPFTIGGICSKDILWIYETGNWNYCYNNSFNELIEQYINLTFKSYEKYFREKED